MNDWDRMSRDRLCGTCRYYNNNRCRRHAPLREGWPVVCPIDWCGDYELTKAVLQAIDLPDTPGDLAL